MSADFASIFSVGATQGSNSCANCYHLSNTKDKAQVATLTRAPTREAHIRPRRFFVDSKFGMSMTIPAHLFYIICASTVVPSYFWSWDHQPPGQVERLDLTSLFCNFETVLEPEYMTQRLKTCGILLTHGYLQFVYLGFLYWWSKVKSISCCPHYKSMEKSQMNLFLINTLCISKLYHEWRSWPS